MTARLNVECPACHAQHTSHTCTTEDAAPVDGDVTVCASCFALLVFTPSLQLRLMTDRDRADLTAEDRRQIYLAREAIGRMRGLS